MRRTMKKAVAVGLAAATAFSLCACGGGDGSKGSSKDALEVVIWDNNQQKGLQQTCDPLTQQTRINADAQIKQRNSYRTLLEAGASGGDMPDVFWMHSNNSQMYMKNNKLLKLDDYIEKSDKVDMSNYMSEITELYTYDGSYYAVPKDYDTIALWYNKTLFDEAGLDYPTADWTWDDVTEAAKKLTKDDGSQYGLGMRNDNNQAGYYNLIYDNGGYIISDDKTKSGWDDEKTIAAMQTLEGWIKDGVIPSLETMSENNEDVLFEAGKIAMTCQGSWMLAAFKENEYTAANCDCVELPKNAETGRRASLYNGLGWAASASGEHTDEAWQLIEYLGSKEAQEKQAELGVTMSAYKDTSDAWAKSADFNLQAYLNMMDDMEIRPYSKSTVTWENEDNEILKGVYTGDITMEEACKQMADQMNEKLAEE